MSDKSKIEWTDATWNPVTGCTKVSAGCKHCYAERQWSRMTKLAPSYAGRDFTDVACHPERLEQPLRWNKPRMIFVNSMSDLFHEDVPDSYIDQVFAVMALAPQHTFQVLTKRVERMRLYLRGLSDDDENGGSRITTAVNAVLLGSCRSWGTCGSTSTAITTISTGSGAREPNMLRSCSDGIGVERLCRWADVEIWNRCADIYAERVRADGFLDADFGWGLKMWPLPNVWLGVSVEDQQTAHERIPLLLDTPAAARWVSAEPLIGRVNLRCLFGLVTDDEDVRIDALDGTFVTSRYQETPTQLGSKIDWVVVGGESGPNARPMHPEWARSLRKQCAASSVPFLFKQWGEWAPRSECYHTLTCGQAAADIDPGATKWPCVRLTAKGNNGRDLANACDGDDCYMQKVGKKLAGRLLDGVQHDGYPGDAA